MPDLDLVMINAKLDKLIALAEETDRDLIGLCPHGYLKCFYCWRDAGFPGAKNA